jgi:hypothetical protein
MLVGFQIQILADFRLDVANHILQLPTHCAWTIIILQLQNLQPNRTCYSVAIPPIDSRRVVLSTLVILGLLSGSDLHFQKYGQ